MSLLQRISKYVLEKIAFQSVLKIQLDITAKCNLSCKHCYHSKKDSSREELNIHQWEYIYNRYCLLLKKLQLAPVVYLCGGEPLASDLLFPIIEMIHKKHTQVSIGLLTNGTLITEELLDKLLKFKPTFQISLDGADELVHDSIRGDGSFCDAENGIKLAVKKGFSVSIQATLSRFNSHQIESYFRLAKELNVDSMNFTRFVPTGVGKASFEGESSIELLRDDLRQVYDNIIKMSLMYKVKTNTTSPLFAPFGKGFGNYNNFGYQGLVVDEKGDLKVSSRSEYRLGNCLEENLEDLFLNHPIMKKLRLADIEGCGKCSYFQRCGGDRNISFAHYGSFFRKDPGCWL